MAICGDFQTDAVVREFREQGFDNQLRVRRLQSTVQVAGILYIGLLAVLLAAFIAFHPLSAGASAAEQGAALGKSDRIESTQPEACKDRVRGAWLVECSSALAGNTAVRRAGFVTVDLPSAEPNTSNLMRVPKGS